MSFDTNQMFHEDEALTADGNSASLLVGPGEYDITIIVKSVSASDSVIFKAQESADDSTYVDLALFPSITAAGEYHRKVKTELEYLRLNRDVTGTDVSIVVSAGLTRGKSGGANA